MASTFETGFAKNVDSFESLTTFCETQSDIYQPANKELQLTTLQAKLDIAKAELENVNELTPAYKTAVNLQEDEFAGVNKLSTRIKLLLHASTTL